MESRKRALLSPLTCQETVTTPPAPVHLSARLHVDSVCARTQGSLTTLRKTRSHNLFPQMALFPEQRIQIFPLGYPINYSAGSFSAGMVLLLFLSFQCHSLVPPASETSKPQIGTLSIVLFFLLTHIHSEIKSGQF